MNTTIIVLIASIIGFSMLRYATRIIMKLIGFLVLVAVVVFLLFYFGIGPFKENPLSVDYLKAKYCVSEVDKTKCDCIVSPIEQDMQKRWTPAELSYLEQHRTQMGYAVSRSFDKIRPEIERCLIEKGEEDALDEVLQDMIPVNDEWKQRLGYWRDNLKQKADSVLDSARSKKDWIDERYED